MLGLRDLRITRQFSGDISSLDHFPNTNYFFSDQSGCALRVLQHLPKRLNIANNVYSGTPLIRPPKGLKYLVVQRGGRINEVNMTALISSWDKIKWSL